MTKKSNTGCWIDDDGNAVPVKHITAIDKKKERVVIKIVANAQKVSEALRTLKVDAVELITQYLDDEARALGLNDKQLDEARKARKGNKRLRNFSNTMMVEMKSNDINEFDTSLDAAKSLIDNCVKRWSDGANEALIVLVNDALQIDKEGKYNRSGLLRLKRLKINDAEFRQAQKIISNAEMVITSKTYLVIQIKDKEGNWQGVPLSIANV